ncbi:MAG: hypothetical protein WCO04_04085 [Pseudomonadota bacterium]
MSKIHVFTSFTYSYLNRARVLASTVRRHNPDWVIWAILTDKLPEGVLLPDSLKGFDKVLTVEEIFGNETRKWLFGHDIVEACTAVKGRALQWIMREPGVEKVIYLDPDIAVFNSLDPIATLLDTHPIILTPHLRDPEDRADVTAIQDNEMGSLMHGAYNLGFIAVNQSDEAHRFANWWADRLHDWCHDRRDIGVFVDQKWCDLIPCFFDDVKVLRDPGYNVASWNLSKRKLHFDLAGRALINGHLLRFFHFTKLGPIGDVMTRRYAGDNSEIYELWWWYRHAVELASEPAIPAGWWRYGTFENGVQIPKDGRELYRVRGDLRAAFPDPYLSGSNTFQEWLKL